MTRRRTWAIGVVIAAPLLALTAGCATTPRVTVTSVQLRPDGASESAGEVSTQQPFLLPAGVAGTIEVFFTINVRNHENCVLDLDGSRAVTPVDVGAEDWMGERMVSLRTPGLVLDRAVTGLLRCAESPQAFGSTWASDDFSVATKLEIISTVVTGGQVQFGSVQAGSRSSAEEVLLGNLGSLSAKVASVRVTGTDAASFAVSLDTCSGSTLDRNASCSLRVTFEPRSAGAQSALLELSLTSADPDHPDDVTHLVLLTGTGTEPPPPPPPPPQDQPHHPPTG